MTKFRPISDLGSRAARFGITGVLSTLVAYAAGGRVNSTNIRDVALLALSSMAGQFESRYVALPEAYKVQYADYLHWVVAFRKAEANFNLFYEERGTPGTYTQIRTTPDGKADYSEVVDHVLRALA